MKVFKIKYLSPTTHRGTRISITDITYDWDIKRKILDMDYKFDTAREQAMDYIDRNYLEIYTNHFMDGDILYLIYG
jgi:hypothetical protein